MNAAAAFVFVSIEASAASHSSVDLKIEDSDDDDYNKYFQEFYNNSFCIKKFYSSQERKYYDKNDIGFQWPLLSTLETKEGYDNSE